jgi:F420-non-reducing hydrogenase iron-sulfur subunit
MEILPEHSAITVFVCANCARSAHVPSSAHRTRPVVPDFNWPAPTKQVILPCTGRLQPEHILKAFEAGSSVVSVVACREDNCHHVEGSRRCAHRIDYIRSLLNEIGLGEGRLLFFKLPGSASEDMALGAGKAVPECAANLDSFVASVRDESIRALATLPPNPLQFLEDANGGSDE